SDSGELLNSQSRRRSKTAGPETLRSSENDRRSKTAPEAFRRLLFTDSSSNSPSIISDIMDNSTEGVDPYAPVDAEIRRHRQYSSVVVPSSVRSEPGDRRKGISPALSIFGIGT